MRFSEKLRQLFGDRTAKLFRIHNRDCPAIVARHIMADADSDQFDRRAGFDFLDNMAQMPLEIITRIDRQR